MIRKGLDAGLKPELDDNVDRLHAVYAASVHRLGTPVFAKRYFTELQRTFGEDCEILTIVKGGRAVASVMSFYFRDEVLPYYGGTLPEGRSIAASDVMYHELMRHAVARPVLPGSTSAAARPAPAPSTSSATGASRPSR